MISQRHREDGTISSQMFLPLGYYFAFLASGALTYTILEGWSIIDSLYFSCVTMASVGLGDIAVATTLGKLFTSVFILASIGFHRCLVLYLAAFQHTHFNTYLRRLQQTLLSKSVSRSTYDTSSNNVFTTFSTGLHHILKHKLAFSAFVVFVYVIFGTFTFMILENLMGTPSSSTSWGLIDSLYFCVSLISSVGYGDMAPSFALSKLFLIVYVLLSMGPMSMLIDSIGSIVINQASLCQLAHFTSKAQSPAQPAPVQTSERVQERSPVPIDDEVAGITSSSPVAPVPEFPTFPSSIPELAPAEELSEEDGRSKKSD